MKTATQASPKDQFLQSLERCAASEEFLADFYRRFLASSPEVRKKFADTDFTAQRQMLLRSLRLAAGATAGEPDALHELHERGETHSRDQLDIGPHLYDLWLNSILKSAAHFDPEWSTGTEQVWRRILGYVVHLMVRHY